MENGEYMNNEFWAAENRFACKRCNKTGQDSKERKHAAACCIVAVPAPPTTSQPDPAADTAPDIPLPTAPDGLPSLAEVCASPVDTMKKLPKTVMSHWTRSFTRLETAVMFQNTVAVWILLAMFSKCVTPLPVRGGKNAGGPTNAQRIEANLKLWDAGEYTALWRKSTRKRGKSNASASDTKRAERSEDLTRDGQYSRAMASLISEDLAPVTEETCAKLKEKHPAPLRQPPILQPPKASPPITEETVRDALRSFGKGTSGGTMGLRAEYLLGALNETTPVGFLTTLTKMVNWLKDAKAPLIVQPYFAGARLTALIKKNRDVRPIAAGEILRRLVAKCLCATHKDAAAAHFKGYQYGVATPAGAERMIHFLRRTMAAHATDTDWVVLKVDLKNAFNCISRARLLELVLVHAPDMYHWVDWCYRTSSVLTFSDFRVGSREGVQQGDPLGPFLFSLVIHALILRISAELPGLDVNKWYLDDGVIAGKSADVRRALDIIAGLDTMEVGVFLNEGKCELVTHPAAAGCLSAFPASIPDKMRRTDGCTSLLGAPIGDDHFCAQFVRDDSLEPAQRTLKRLGLVRDPQVAMTLLRHCTGFCQFVYALRATPPHQLADVGDEFDNIVMAALQVASFALPNDKLSQVRRGTRSGGLGIRSVSMHREAAYISSVCFAASSDGWDATSAPGYCDAVTAYNSKVAPDRALVIGAGGIAHVVVARIAAPAGDVAAWPSASPDLNPAEVIFSSLTTEAVPVATSSPKQKDLSAAIDQTAFAAEFAAATGMGRRRLTSQSGVHASRWLTVVPDPARHQDFAPREYTMLLRWWLGMDVYESAGPCPACGQHMDTKGYHALCCKKWGGKVYRHHTLCNVYATFARGAFLAPQREVSVGGGRTRPADVYLPIWEGRPLALDFAVTHPLQPKYSKLADCAPAGSVAAAYAANHKRAPISACRRAGVDFRGMVCETFGAWDPSALPILSETATMYALHQGVTPSIALQYLSTRLSVALMRQNVRILLARAPTLDHEGEDDVSPSELSDVDSVASDDSDEDRLQESINGDDTSDAPEHQDTDSDEDDLAGFDDTECGRADGGVTGSEADAGAL